MYKLYLGLVLSNFGFGLFNQALLLALLNSKLVEEKSLQFPLSGAGLN